MTIILSLIYLSVWWLEVLIVDVTILARVDPKIATFTEVFQK